MTRIAIVGMGGVFPGAATLDEFWENLRDGRDSTAQVTAGRWVLEPESIHDPNRGLDRVATTRGGYVEPGPADLLVRAGRQAFEGLSVAPEKAGVIVGNIVLPTAAPTSIGAPATALAEALGISGCAFTLDAACSSSLYALKLATIELESGRADVMLAGGMNKADSLYTQMGFTQLRALSSGWKPFSRAPSSKQHLALRDVPPVTMK